MRCKLTVSTKIRSQWLLWVVMAKENLHWWNVTWLLCELWCRKLRRQHSNLRWCNTMVLFFRPQLKKKFFVTERFSKSYQIYFCFRSNLLNSEREKVISLRRNKKFWHRGIWYKSKSNQINDFWYLSLGFQAFLTFHCPVDCYLRVFLGSTEGWLL